jgi:hypothetical protein
MQSTDPWKESFPVTPGKHPGGFLFVSRKGGKHGKEELS